MLRALRSTIFPWVLAAAVAGILIAPGQAGAQAKDRVVVVSGVDANTLDPHFMQTVNPEWLLRNHIFDGLVWRDDSMRTVPMLAESWNTLDDRTWVFKLRKGVTFHNGEVFNAASVRFTFERARDPKLKALNRTPKDIDLDRVEIVDDYTVRLITKSPSPSLLSRLFEFVMLPPKYYGTASPQEAARRPIGSGPYTFVEWVRDERIVLEANPNYWRGLAKIKTVVWRPIPEAGTRIAELLTGGADIIVNVPPDQAKGLNTKTTRSESIQGLRKIHIGMKMQPGSPLADKRVRHALNYAVDVETICRTVLGGYCKRMASFVNAPNDNPALKPWPYDPGKTKELLTAAGYPNGFGVTLDTPDGRYMKDKDVAQAVADYLTKVGVKAAVRPLAWSVFFGQMVKLRKTDEIYLLGLGTFVDPLIEVQMLVHDHVNNATGWLSNEYEDLYKTASATMNDAKRQQLLFRMQEIAWEEAPWIWLYKQYDIYGVSRRLSWKPRPDERIYLYGVSVSE